MGNCKRSTDLHGLITLSVMISSSCNTIDETSSLLSNDITTAMKSSPLDNIELGYGTSSSNVTDTDLISDTKTVISASTSTTDTVTTDEIAASSNAEEDKTREDDETTIYKRHKWLLPFFINIFLACASFSIVMPSLTSYILHINAPLDFLPWVVSTYSAGEMLGSVAIGHYYEYATKTYDKIGLGPKSSLMICMSLGVVGSALYVSAGWIEDKTAAKYCLLGARFIQGMWTGGQQSVEQAYLSVSVHPSKRTEYTATLSTCGVMGFVMGPAIGAGLSLIDTTILGLRINSDNSAGVFMLIATSVMFWQTLLFFDGKDDKTGLSIVADKDVKKECDVADNDESKKHITDETAVPFNHMGVSLCMIIFYMHYYSFAVQETVIVPMAMLLYSWDALEINLLFLGVGMLSLVTALSVRYLTRYAEDRIMLIMSIFAGFLGSVMLIDLPFNRTLPMWRFLVGFSFITVAFPIGRNVVLGIFGSVLGEVNQGRWMGILFSISAFPRVIGPFVSLELLKSVDWQSWLEFGIIASLFCVSLIVTWANMDDLVSYAEFSEKEERRIQKKLAKKVNKK